MEAYEFLSRAYRLDQQIQAKVEQLSRIRAYATGSAAWANDVKVQVSGPGFRVEDAVVAILDEEREINEEIDRLVEIRREIREVISRVGDVTCRLLLEKRDLLFEPWPKICRDLHMSLRSAQTWHKDAVGMVQEILDGMYPEG